MGGQTSRSISEQVSAAAKESAKEVVGGRECAHTPKHKQYSLPHKSPKLDDRDFSFLTEHTGKSREEVQNIFDKYNLNKPDAKIDKDGFINIYQELHPESKDHVRDVAEHVFRAFDSECSGYISFNEFLVAYALTNRGDMRKKLDYAFELYDEKKSGYLNQDEVKDVVTGMCDVLGIDQKHDNPPELIEKTIREIHAEQGIVSKGKE
jgi:Ca2+-binding EF-hand superfamily protein